MYGEAHEASEESQRMHGDLLWFEFGHSQGYLRITKLLQRILYKLRKYGKQISKDSVSTSNQPKES